MEKVAALTRKAALALGALVGALTALCAFDLSFIAGTAPYWSNPRGDVKMQVTGYLHFIDEPWGYPLLVARSIHPPAGYNVARADTIPLVALVAKLLRPLVPHALTETLHHPFGLWLALLFVLQGLLAARFAWTLGVRTRVGVGCAATLACTMPAFLLRSGHTSLEAHFFLTWALLLVVIVRSAAPTWRRAGEWVLLLTLVALVHLYLFAMCSALFAAWLVTALVVHRRPMVPSVAVLLGFATAFGAMFVVGLLAEPLHWAPHFGEASFNPGPLVLTRFALLNPLGRVVDPALAYGTGYQYEGYDYLGLGVLVLLGVVLATQWRALGAALRRHAVLAGFLVFLVLFAASNRVFVGPHLLFSFEVPASLMTLVSQFRSSGRFVWAPTYALVFFLVARAHRRSAWLLGAATLVQVIDVAPHFGWVHDLFGTPDEVAIDRPLWDETLAKHASVVTFPSFDCTWMMRGGWEDPNYKALYQLAYRAAETGKTVSSIHNARPGRDCLDDVRDRETVMPEDDAVYVYMRRAATGQMLERLAAQGARCLPFDRGFACSRKFDDADARRFDATTASATYPLGSWIVFGGDGSASAPFEGGAWGIRTAEGAYVGWPVEGTRSTLHFLLGHPVVHSSEVELEVDAEPGDLAPAEVRVEGGRTYLENIHLSPGESAVVRYRVRPLIRGRDSWVSLDLFEEPPPSPARPRARLRVKRVRLWEHTHRSKRAKIALQTDVAAEEEDD